jgi:aconitate hydratase
MARNVAQQLIESHLVSGEMRPGAEIALSVDQTLTQDAREQPWRWGSQ